MVSVDSMINRASSPPRRRGSKIDVELLSAPEQQEIVFEGILSRRNGSVLARNTILKSDHFGPGRHASMDMRLLGAPNFRQANLNVYGVAQPTISGLATVLRLLKSGPHGENHSEQSCTWFSTREEPLIYINGRPFVLRDRDSPFENIRSYAGISASRLEQMELRLKTDIIEEASKNNELLLVHDEIEGQQQIIPCLTAIQSVKTSAEVFSDMREGGGFNVYYHRVPVSNEQAPIDAYIDEYIRVFHEMPLRKHAVIFSCGIGIGRTTYTMVIGMIIRRALLVRATGTDPFTSEKVSEQDRTTRSVLRLVSVLEQGLETKSSKANRSAVEWALARSSIIDHLKAAILGNYTVIMELVRVLDQGSHYKRIVDDAIDKCEALLNIREHILINRVKHSINEESTALDTGIGYLERYFSLIAFCAFIEESHERVLSFSMWIKERRDIWNMLQNFRRQTDKLNFFRPVDDLTALSTHQNSIMNGSNGDMAEYNVIKSRAGSVLSAHTILKIDHWNPKGLLQSILTGAPNFRQIPNANIFTSAQPTLSALRAIVGMIHERLEPGENISWINVREEPIIYIDNEPYVLRDRYASLRNIKTYSGITADRLEHMELRLKEDILNEAFIYNHRILVHCESSSENIYPSWVSLEREVDVMTLSEIFIQLQESFPKLTYRRLPMTAEEPLEPEHFDAIMETVMINPPGKCHLVFNCQMGASRSTSGAVIAGLVNNWLVQSNSTIDDDDGRGFVTFSMNRIDYNRKVLHYRIIHSVLRAIKNGLLSKAIVDEFVDKAAAVVNLRDCIEKYRELAESASDPKEIRRALAKGIAALKRYAMLILFQGYLFEVKCVKNNVSANSTAETFTSWLSRHMEFKLLLADMDGKGRGGGGGGVEILNEEHALSPNVGIAHSSQVLQVVSNRRGQVLAPMTILKFDHFPGCQKITLPERIEGAPNFREVILESDTSVYGLAMPTKQGFIKTLERINRSTRWLCLREEPVIFVNGRPYVLRIVKDPVANLEMTGIISERVELMEERLKMDILKEIELFSGRLLLHEEDESTGQIMPVWEDVSSENVETTIEIIEAIKKKGYLIDYARIPITDEQAPIPTVFDNLLQLGWEANLNLIYNCQMGRGRTTTGMIISVLLYQVRNLEADYDNCFPVKNDFTIEKIADKVSLTTTTTTTTTTMAGDNATTGTTMGTSCCCPPSPMAFEEERLRYLAGEYKLVMQIIQVLEHGKLAKLLVDSAIDECAHIQNLRTAIYDFKLCEGENRDRGLNYLLRYAFLIIFADYLLELYPSCPKQVESCQPKVSFVDWLQERREILNMINRRDQIDFA